MTSGKPRAASLTRTRCKNLYRFIRLRAGDGPSDRELARRWDMEWKSFAALKHGNRQIPRIHELQALAALLAVPADAVFRVASGDSAHDVDAELAASDGRREREAALSAWRGGLPADERRRSPRAPVAVTVSIASGAAQQSGQVSNLSADGAQLQTERGLATGDEIELRWTAPDDGASVRARAVIVWSRGTDAGARFTALSRRPRAR